MPLTSKQRDVYDFIFSNNGKFGDMTSAAIEYSRLKDGDPVNPREPVVHEVAGSENGILPVINDLARMGYVFVSIDKTLKVRELPRWG